MLSTDTSDPELRNAVAISLERLGCRVSEVIVRSGAILDQSDPVDNEAVAAALLHSDLIVDMGGNLVERSSALDEILEEARILAVDVKCTAQLDALVVHPGLAKRLDRAASLLAGAEVLNISSAAGTSLRIQLAKNDVTVSSGAAADTGDLAHWPSGVIWARAGESQIDGSIVAMPGDLLAEAGHLMRSPVRIEVEGGQFVEVLGDTADADILRSSLESLGDEAAYTISSFGWGMSLTRGIGALGLFDQRRLSLGRGPLTAGRANIRTGTQTNDNGTLTLSLSDATVTADSTEVITEGALEGALAADIYERAAAG